MGVWWVPFSWAWRRLFPVWPGAAFSEKCEIEASTERLVEWTDGFMRNRRIMSVDGQDSEPLEVTTELPQGSYLSSPVCNIHRGHPWSG